MKPDFLYIGPDKSGSSWIHSVLLQHPECFVPDCKDIYYFDKYYHKGIKWYSGYFDVIDPSIKAIGELSHDYLFSKEAAKRIANDLPNVKMFVCLRNPVERSFSHYLYLVRSGITAQSFGDALKSFPEIIENSLYFKHLATYYENFNSDQIKILWFDDLKEDAIRFAKEMFDYLNLSFVEGIDYDKKIRVASKPRVFVLAKLMKFGAGIARDMGFAGLVGKIKHSKVAGLLYKEYKNDKPRMSLEDKLFLIECFRDDVQQLEKLTNKDLVEWLS